MKEPCVKQSEEMVLIIIYEQEDMTFGEQPGGLRENSGIS
jgi:hypothetical protein